MASVIGASVAAMGASTLTAGAHSSILSLLVIAAGLMIVLESLTEGRRPLRTWGVVLALVGLSATNGPFATTLGGGSAAGVMYLLSGLVSLSVDLATPPT